MKTKSLLLFFLMVCFATAAMAQIPGGFNYQAIARDASNNVIPSYTFPLVKFNIQTSAGGGIIYQETFSNVTTNTFGLFTLVVGTGTPTVGSFASINWNQTLFLKTIIEYPGTTMTTMGTTQIWSVPYAMISDKTNGVNTGTKLSVVSANDAGTDALLEVKRADGHTVFAVYPDSVRVSVPNTIAKGSKGGFAVGGFDPGKSNDTREYLRVNPDSVRVYINPNQATKGSKGGFAVGGYDSGKGSSSLYFNLTSSSTVSTVAASPQVLWYPTKNAFLAGNVHIASPDSVGNYSTALGYQSSARGNYSQAFGYKAIAAGNYSTSIGKNSVAGIYNSHHNAFALGNMAQALGEGSYAFGSGAQATGQNSFAFGSVAIDSAGHALSTPTTASGTYSTAIGMGAQATNTGSLAFGNSSASGGYASLAMGFYSNVLSTSDYGVAIGYYSKSAGRYGISFGLKSNSQSDGALAIGAYAITGTSAAYAGSFGYGANVQAPYSIAIGYRANTASTASNAGSFGYYASASGPYSISMGPYSTTGSSANYAGSFGYSADAYAPNSVAVGYNAQTAATATSAGAFGYNAVANGVTSVAIGPSATTGSGGTNASSFGYTAAANGVNSVAVGYGAITSAQDASAFGKLANASGTTSMALGISASSVGSNSIAIGNTAVSNAPNSTSLGSNTTTGASANYSTALGYGSSTAGQYSTALGYMAQANGAKSVSIGSYYNYTFYRFIYDPITHRFRIIPYTITQYNVASDDYSVALGNGNTAQGGGLAVGSYNFAYKTGAVAIGHTNYADSLYSFAGGEYATSVGYNAFALGQSVTAEAQNSFVIGYNNVTNTSYTRNDWVATDPLFVIGNGGSGTQSDAFRVLKNGNTVVYATDSYSGLNVNNNSSGFSGTMYGLYNTNHNANTANTSSIYGLYNYAQNDAAGYGYTYGSYSLAENTSSSTSPVYGAYSYGYNLGTSTTYGSYTYARNTTTSTSSMYTGYFSGYNYGSGTNYGLRSYAVNESGTGSFYSGYFSGINNGSGTYYGLYADTRSGGSVDLAEYIYDTNKDTKPADVVVADPNIKESVVKSSKPYQTGVLGVISTKPHMTMGMEIITDTVTGKPLAGVSATRLALSGRVPVNVCGENGNIKPGDYLTTSSKPGFAMKWTLLDVNAAKDFEDMKKILAENERRRGTIIGKAVESFSGTGTGKIKILVSLQ